MQPPVVSRPKGNQGCNRLCKVYSRSHDAVIRVYDAAGNEIETHQHAGDFKSGELLLSSHRSSAKPNAHDSAFIA